jgi:hypothetical protein
VSEFNDRTLLAFGIDILLSIFVNIEHDHTLASGQVHALDFDGREERLEHQ